MKFFAVTKLIILSGAGVILFSFSSVAFGQDCSNDAGAVFCEKEQEPACGVKDGKFDGHCTTVKAELLLSGQSAEFEADYYFKVSGTKVPVSNIKEKKYQDQLNNGRIEKADGTVVTFTPIGTVKASVMANQQRYYQTPGERRFFLRSELDGLDKAIDEYKINLTPVTPRFFLNIAKAFLLQEKTAEAVKILRLNIEIHDSAEAENEFAKALIKLSDEFVHNGNKDKAIVVLSEAIKVKNTSAEIKTMANQRLTNLQRPQ